MKTLLNLLPEENKKNIQRKTHFRFFLWQLFLLFALEIFYVSILVSIYFVLDSQLQNLQAVGQQNEKIRLEQIQLNEYQKKFKEINVTTEAIGKIQDNHFTFTQVFYLLDTLLPERITIDYLTTKNYTVLLTGKAVKRDDLLEFDAKLKESPCVENVNVPISNLFSQENIDFQVDFGIKKECLKKSL
jgi:Tfp pilus assembly protein PilN